MTVTRAAFVAVLIAICVYNSILLSIGLPVLIFAFVIWLLAIPFLMIIALLWEKSGQVRKPAFGGLIVGLIGGVAVIATKPDYQLDSDWATVSSDFSVSAPLLEKYMLAHATCPSSSMELRGRPMFDPFSRKDYVYTKVGAECGIYSVGFDRVDNSMSRAARPDLRVLRSDQFPLNRVIFGKAFSDNSAADGDVWIRCGRENGCRSSF